MKVRRSDGHLLKKSQGTKTEPVEGTKKESEQDKRYSKSFKAFCLCGRKMVQTTPEDVWNGVQPRCDKCEGW